MDHGALQETRSVVAVGESLLGTNSYQVCDFIHMQKKRFEEEKKNPFILYPTFKHYLLCCQVAEGEIPLKAAKGYMSFMLAFVLFCFVQIA